MWRLKRTDDLSYSPQSALARIAQSDGGAECLRIDAMRLLIVEPDAAAAQFFRHLSQQQDDIAEVGTTDSAEAALQYIGAKPPDLLVLEVELGDMTGFDVLRSTQPKDTQAIMVSNCEQHAVEALRMGAVDYLRKPVTAGQFLHALRRAQALHTANRSHDDHGRIATRESSGSRAARSSRLIGERSNRYYFIEIDDVDFIEAYGNYVKIHVGTNQYLRRDTLRRLATALSDNGFELVRRSTLINLKRVMFAEKCGEGALAFKLCSGVRLVSRTRFKLNESSLAYGMRP
jgi:two-component system LytT family response regulator